MQAPQSHLDPAQKGTVISNLKLLGRRWLCGVAYRPDADPADEASET